MSKIGRTDESQQEEKHEHSSEGDSLPKETEIPRGEGLAQLSGQPIHEQAPDRDDTMDFHSMQNFALANKCQYAILHTRSNRAFFIFLISDKEGMPTEQIRILLAWILLFHGVALILSTVYLYYNKELQASVCGKCLLIFQSLMNI
ncbi:hypothetical protein ACJX0J_033440 [Zea mays]